jgi:hypothetical protein
MKERIGIVVSLTIDPKLKVSQRSVNHRSSESTYNYSDPPRPHPQTE